MNKRIEKVREDIRLTENRIREMNEYLKTLKQKEKRLCDDEILKTMRQMAGKGGDVMEILKQLQEGGISEMAEPDMEPVEERKLPASKEISGKDADGYETKEADNEEE